jgi:pimeloyl-ACP methyl ester carboxylesterase
MGNASADGPGGSNTLSAQRLAGRRAGAAERRARSPIGADRVSTRLAYAQVASDALSSARPSAATLSLLHRYGLERLAARDAPKALLSLHQKALDTGGRDLLFALAELSYTAGQQVRRGLKPWDAGDARDFYLGSPVYAYLFLFSQANGPKPDAFDRRFRAACDLYNYGLGWALTERRGSNPVARLEEGKRRLPVGEIALRLNLSNFPWPLDLFERFLVADQFRVRGLSVRNRQAGLGSPLIAVLNAEPSLRVQRAAPVTVLLRVQGGLADIAAGTASAALELHSAFNTDCITIDDTRVPLELDLTTPRAYALNQASAWKAGHRQFYSPATWLRSQLVLTQPYQAGRVPVVLVHGTWASAVKWCDMLNTLNADPALRQGCQFWMFLYSSSKSLAVSAMELRDELGATVQRLDPEGKDLALRQMVIIGHSQGGLLAKLTATETGDQLWRVLSNKQPADFNLTAEQLAFVKKALFPQPLPFVRRVIFVSTPHRGSYLATNWARKLVWMFLRLPRTVSQRIADLMSRIQELKLPAAFKGNVPTTSLDSMSPQNPLLLKLADIPVARSVTAHSIIAVQGSGDYHAGKDGVVAYASAHVDYVASEFIAQGAHSCQNEPTVIEEVRRILHEHLREVSSQGLSPRARASSAVQPSGAPDAAGKL